MGESRACGTGQLVVVAVVLNADPLVTSAAAQAIFLWWISCGLGEGLRFGRGRAPLPPLFLTWTLWLLVLLAVYFLIAGSGNTSRFVHRLGRLLGLLRCSLLGRFILQAQLVGSLLLVSLVFLVQTGAGHLGGLSGNLAFRTSGS